MTEEMVQLKCVEQKSCNDAYFLQRDHIEATASNTDRLLAWRISCCAEN